MNGELQRKFQTSHTQTNAHAHILLRSHARHHYYFSVRKCEDRNGKKEPKILLYSHRHRVEFLCVFGAVFCWDEARLYTKFVKSLYVYSLCVCVWVTLHGSFYSVFLFIRCVDCICRRSNRLFTMTEGGVNEKKVRIQSWSWSAKAMHFIRKIVGRITLYVIRWKKNKAPHNHRRIAGICVAFISIHRPTVNWNVISWNIFCLFIGATFCFGLFKFFLYVL